MRVPTILYGAQVAGEGLAIGVAGGVSAFGVAGVGINRGGWAGLAMVAAGVALGWVSLWLMARHRACRLEVTADRVVVQNVFDRHVLSRAQIAGVGVVRGITGQFMMGLRVQGADRLIPVTVVRPSGVRRHRVALAEFHATLADMSETLLGSAEVIGEVVRQGPFRAAAALLGAGLLIGAMVWAADELPAAKPYLDAAVPLTVCLGLVAGYRLRK